MPWRRLTLKWALRTFCSPPAGCPLSWRLAREAPRGLTLRPRLHRGLLASVLGGQISLAKTEIPFAKIIQAVSLCRAGGWSTFPITSTGKPANGSDRQETARTATRSQRETGGGRSRTESQRETGGGRFGRKASGKPEAERPLGAKGKPEATGVERLMGILRDRHG
jgi:hypothetical protein